MSTDLPNFSLQNNGDPIGKIEGKTTAYSCTIRLYAPIPRTAYLTVLHENHDLVLGIHKLWNDASGYFAKVGIIGDPPLSPFPVDAEVRYAKEEQIHKVLGLLEDKAKSVHIGELLYSSIPVTLNVEKLGRVFITGKTGSGKSYTVGVLIEELLMKQIPVVIIDRHGEYTALKFPDLTSTSPDAAFFQHPEAENSYVAHIIEFGLPESNPTIDLGLEYLIAADVVDLIRSGQCILINLSGLDLEVQESIAANFCYKLYKASVARQIPPHFVFLDEAHQFAGKKKSELVDILRLSAQEGRKFGHNLVVITQKPQLLDVTIRSQAGTWIIHKLTDVNDVKITTSSAEGLGQDADEEIQNLAPGEAIISGDLAPTSPLRVKIRKRYTRHGGVGFNPLNFVSPDANLPKSVLVDLLRQNISDDLLHKTKTDLSIGETKTVSDLQYRIEALVKENLLLKDQLTQGSLGVPPSLPTSEVSVEEKEPVPGEMYDKKMLEVMEERDDLKIKLEEQEKKCQDLEEMCQTVQLELSGTKVDNETLKNKAEREAKRAEEAVALAERALVTMKKKK